MATSKYPNDLDDLKYAELQKIAKEVGVKANMKAAKLLQALKDYYSSTSDKENDTSSQQNSPSTVINEDASLTSKLNESSDFEKDNQSRKEKKPTRKPKKARRGGKLTSKDKKEVENVQHEPQVEVMTEQAEENRPPTPDLLVKGVKMTPVPTPVKNATPGSSSGGARKRKRTKTPETKLNSTFEIENTTEAAAVDSAEAQEEITGQTKRARRNTYEVEKTSPGTKMIVENLTQEMDSDAMKASLMDAIEKKVQEKKATLPPPQSKTGSSSNIPRFAAFLAKQKQDGASSAKKPITPGNKDWSKIHQRQFSKMESIDVYLAKKNRRTEEMTASVKKARLLAEQTRKAVETIKNHRTPTHKGAKIVRPVKGGLTFKSPAHAGVPFVPTVTSTSKMTINFAGTKTPSFTAGSKPVTGFKSSTRKSPRLSDNTKENQPKKSMGAPVLSTVTSFNLNVTQPTPAKKPVFDLKASLSKPITWKVHKGKLQPWEVKKSSYKAHQPQTKEDRVKAAKANRADKKFNMAMQRRGIVA